MTINQTIISIDPGREKCGIAVVHKEKGVLKQAVIDTINLVTTVEQLTNNYNTNTIIMGDGTSSKEAEKKLKELEKNEKSMTLILVDEYRTTDEGRLRYWRENPPKGLKRLIPVTMQVPPCPVDDYVAVILAERYFSKMLTI
ncbi:Holliday junction resolvase RuvX [Pelosinus sp. UFO1]|uniref:Holliday junction resolvase RuvX n=1 Tax=Pelosinus sp. UFO1 TaxID=484770 RepID=UPI0004D0E0E4|nr:Holliday junction resolvase RuvX [Pelosinus sp. UFO1]AIF53747.1 Holliday junction resolvase YqgF [Pelosinus sp. UFO1]